MSEEKTVEDLLDQLDTTISDAFWKHHKSTQGDKTIVMFPLQIRINHEEIGDPVISVVAPSLSEVEMFLDLAEDKAQFFTTHKEAVAWLEKVKNIK